MAGWRAFGALSKGHIPEGARCLHELKASVLGGQHAVFPVLGHCKAWEAKALIAPPMLGLLREVADGTEASLHRARAYACVSGVYACLAETLSLWPRDNAPGAQRQCVWGTETHCVCSPRSAG